MDGKYQILVDSGTLSVINAQQQGLCTENVSVGGKIRSPILRPNVQVRISLKHFYSELLAINFLQCVPWLNYVIGLRYINYIIIFRTYV